MNHVGVWAADETDLMLRITSKFCHHPSQRRLVLDVGSNIGYFALLAAAQGCKAQAFDGKRARVWVCRHGQAIVTLLVPGFLQQARFPHFPVVLF